MLFQAILIVFALFAIAKTSKMYKQQKVSVYWFMVWTFFWLVVITVSIWPTTTDIVAGWVGVEKGADLLSYSAIVVLFYAMYRVMAGQERQNKELTDLVRKIAIMEAKKPGSRGENK
ncbi:MAG: DUF2304 domain-containing protein [Candidatus Uhrbacteria bacterium]|nr:DUF2304 domain-containing protein [Candidatus Uhrbacteria bacterium]